MKDLVLSNYPIVELQQLYKLGLRRNVVVQIDTARLFSYRAQVIGKHPHPLKAADVRLKIIDDTDKKYYLIGCEFVMVKKSFYYFIGDEFELFRVNHILQVGEKIGDFVFGLFQSTYHPRFRYIKYGCVLATSFCLCEKEIKNV